MFVEPLLLCGQEGSKDIILGTELLITAILAGVGGVE